MWQRSSVNGSSHIQHYATWADQYLKLVPVFYIQVQIQNKPYLSLAALSRLSPNLSGVLGSSGLLVAKSQRMPRVTNPSEHYINSSYDMYVSSEGTTGASLQKLSRPDRHMTGLSQISVDSRKRVAKGTDPDVSCGGSRPANVKDARLILPRPGWNLSRKGDIRKSWNLDVTGQRNLMKWR